MKITERKPAESCAVMAAEDGDVAILMECNGFDPSAMVLIAFDNDMLVLQQTGVVIACVSGIDVNTADMVEHAISVSVINVEGAGTPSESYTVNANTKVTKREG